MGTFEKLGILVIVVIIVMILAVAIYQWGGDDGTGALSPACGPGLNAPTLDIDGRDAASRTGGDKNAVSTAWKDGVPKEHVLVSGENVWELVRRWKLRESFIHEIRRANPGRSFESLQAGQILRIPDPTGFGLRDRGPQPKRAQKPRSYEVQEGDTLGGIALKHLGTSKRWKEIKGLNPGLSPRTMRAGITIMLPAK